MLKICDKERPTMSANPRRCCSTCVRNLGLSETKQTTDDLMFTVEVVSCLSACGPSPSHDESTSRSVPK